MQCYYEMTWHEMWHLQVHDSLELRFFAVYIRFVLFSINTWPVFIRRKKKEKETDTDTDNKLQFK